MAKSHIRAITPIKLEIRSLLRANRQDWKALFEKPMTKAQRGTVRKRINSRNERLAKAIELKWALEGKNRRVK
jgi:hypothetical protein